MCYEQGGRRRYYNYLIWEMLGTLDEDVDDEVSLNVYDFVKDKPYKYPIWNRSKEDDDVVFARHVNLIPEEIGPQVGNKNKMYKFETQFNVTIVKNHDCG